MHEWAHTLHTYTHKVIFMDTHVYTATNTKTNNPDAHTLTHASAHVCTLTLQHVSGLQGLI